MDRRRFLLGGLALGLAACAPAPLAAMAFQPTRFSVDVRGSGPDVILIPGLGGGRSVWNEVVAAVPGYRYHLVQVSGFAGEPVRTNREGPVLRPIVDELARYIADRRLARPAIVGHSMGGTLAMMLAARRPDLAGRVMVVDMLPQPASLFGGTADGAGSILGNMTSSPGGRRLVGSLLSVFSPPDSHHRLSDPDVVARAMHELAGTDLGPRLPGIQVPLTIVYASPDARAAAAIDRSFASAYRGAPDVRLVRIDNSGHMVMLDQPAAFSAALRGFLQA